MPQFIETQFPIARLSAESYKERKAGASQTLTGLGKWWGRKPLILVRAAIIGMLMPASDDPKKDREIFLKILTMDDDGAWQRCKGEIPVAEWLRVAPPEVLEEHFSSRGFKTGTTDGEKEEIKDRIWNSLTAKQRTELDALRNRPVNDRTVFDALPYAERIQYCDRPENVQGPSINAWNSINAHLGTTASTVQQLTEQLGQRVFGHIPRVGDCFCGGGSIPFEAARIGCESFGSDLNPVAGLLTWASLNLLGGGEEVQSQIRVAQEEVFAAANSQIVEWGIESNSEGERAEVYCYCVEVKPEGCEYYIPLAPSWVVSEKLRNVVSWSRVKGSNRLEPTMLTVSATEFKQYKEKKGATIVSGRVIDPFNPERSWSLEALRGIEGLRYFSNEDIEPRQSDTFQERLYCIGWADRHSGKRRYDAPTAEDLDRERKVVSLLKERLVEWQENGFIPSRIIPEGGDKTDEPIRTRGWTFWHHLFTARQLLIHGCYLSKLRPEHSLHSMLAISMKLAVQTNWNSKLCIWNPDKSKGPGANEQTFANQALNPLYNFGTRSFWLLKDSLLQPLKVSSVANQSARIELQDARDIDQNCDIWITDPPYADAINYHELADFFLAWYETQLSNAFPTWLMDSRAQLAVRGDGDGFRRSMVEIYRNLACHMSDNGMQMVMFTHQNPGVWADLGMILWAAGLKATAAWTVSTETAAGLKKGNYVQGTVCLVLRKRVSNEPGFLDEIYPMVEDEVRQQIDSMQALDEGDEPNFNDADYQLAAYAAALKVLTQYGNIDGRDVEHEVFAVRARNEKSDFQVVIERALGIACDYLVPRGLDHSWRELSLAERYYLRALDIESRGERRKGMYEELARGFGVTDIRPLLKSDKANGARMHTASGFAATILAQADGAVAEGDTLPTRRGRNSSQVAHPFASAPLRHLLFAVRETAAADNSPEPGRHYLRDTFGQAYWNLRERFISLLEWLAQLGNAAGMEEWHEDSEAARFLLGRLRNDHA